MAKESILDQLVREGPEDPPKRGQACPTFTIRREEGQPSGYGPRYDRYVEFRAETANGTLLGSVDLVVRPRSKAGPRIYVGFSAVDYKLRRCGLGTKLYHAAAQWACDQGHPLASDTLRSSKSHGFWIKQVKKGRAVCAKPARRLRLDERKYIKGEAVAYGRGNCDHYQMRSCPVPESLAGKRKRR